MYVGTVCVRLDDTVNLFESIRKTVHYLISYIEVTLKSIRNAILDQKVKTSRIVIYLPTTFNF